MQSPICIGLELYKSETIIIQEAKLKFGDKITCPKQTNDNKKQKKRNKINKMPWLFCS